jgi:hypothetical protein
MKYIVPVGLSAISYCRICVSTSSMQKLHTLSNLICNFTLLRIFGPRQSAHLYQSISILLVLLLLYNWGGLTLHQMGCADFACFLARKMIGGSYILFSTLTYRTTHAHRAPTS